MATAAAAWRTLREQVDEEAPDEEILIATEGCPFGKAKSSKSADGVKLSKLEAHPDFPTDFAAQAFMARVPRNLDAVSLATQVAKGAKAGGRAPGPDAASASELAAVLNPPKACSTVKILSVAGPDKFLFVALLDQTLIDPGGFGGASGILVCRLDFQGSPPNLAHARGGWWALQGGRSCLSHVPCGVCKGRLGRVA